jgi:dephospho-CoA kinase
MSLIVAICGLAGSGKSECRKFFEKKGFTYIHLGVTEMVLEKYGYTNEKLERPLRKKLRDENGMDIMIKRELPSISKLVKHKKNIIIDNMYSWAEYKLLKRKYPKKFFVIAIHSNPSIRYKRLKKRSFRGLAEKEAISRDYSHIEELDVGGPIVMADFHILNNKTIRDLNKSLADIYRQIK